MAADSMRQRRLAALGARDRVDGSKRVVGAALIALGFGGAALGYGHGLSIFLVSNYHFAAGQGREILSERRASSLGSNFCAEQLQDLRLRFAPHWGHNPR